MTTTSRERREAVAERLASYFEAYDQWPKQDREDVASEIIAAALPDRGAFADLLDALTELAGKAGRDPFGDVTTGMVWMARQDVVAAVYGADDAQAGEE